MPCSTFRPQHRFLALPFIWSLLAANPADAQMTPPDAPGSKAPPSAESARLAQQMWEWYGHASDLHDAGKLDEAWEVYQKIWKYRKSYDVATSLGSICMRRGNYAQAAHYFHVALDNMVPTQTPEFVAQVTREFESAKTRVVKVVLDHSERLTDEVTLTDLVRRETVSPPIYLQPGSIALRAAFPGQSDVTFRTAAEAGQEVTWDLSKDSEEGGAAVEPSAGGAPGALPVDSPRTSKTRHAAIVLPIGGALTAGLAVGAWLNFKTGQERFDGVTALNLGGSSCIGETEGPCADAAKLRDQGQQADRAGYWFVGGAALAAAATLTVWWLWETESPVDVSIGKEGGLVTWSVVY